MKLAREFLESDLGYKKKGRKRGVHATMLTGPFKPTDIERNSVLSYGKGTNNGGSKLMDARASNQEVLEEPGGLFMSPSSKKLSVFHRRNNSTIDGKIQLMQQNPHMSLNKKKDLRLGLEFLENHNNTFTTRGM